jgi:uncharacterized protein (DUF433 family)
MWRTVDSRPPGIVFAEITPEPESGEWQTARKASFVMVASNNPAVHSTRLESATVRDEKLMSRIAASPKTFGGKPVVRGLRIPVELILSLLAQGAGHAEILNDYPDLVEEDILACLAYARAVVGRDSLEAIEVGGD